jgi:hypothetical protein
MTRIELRHLTAWHSNGQAASVDFADGLTLIHGPSDTGKSFIVSAIDYMLGASKLPQPPELENYTHLLLGINVQGEPFTLTRRLNGGGFTRYSGLRKAVPSNPGDELRAKHGPDSENVSAWLLKACGLEGARLKKNARNETVALSFRDLVHLTVINETKMQARETPAQTGQYTTKTKETAALKLLLEGDDDSDLVAMAAPRDVGKLRNARVEVVDQLIARTEEGLRGTPDRQELEAQLGRIQRAIDNSESEDQQRLVEIRRGSEQVSRDERRVRIMRLRVEEASTLKARFELLQAQYALDLRRLEAILEGGSLLDYFSSGDCPLCGAAPEHQHRDDFDIDPEHLQVSVEAEQARVRANLADLQPTFQELDAQILDARLIGDRARQNIKVTQAALRNLSNRGRIRRDELRRLLDGKTRAESGLRNWQQHSELVSLRSRLLEEDVAEVAARANALPAKIADEFSTAIAQRLRKWGYEALDARFDRNTQDVWANGQFRSDHGKGVRSILQAAFTIGLADYCLARDLPHPGFIVLDSPLITYRAPDFIGWPFQAIESVASKMYRDLQESFEGQVIIMENVEAESKLLEESGDVAFTANLNGRFGFFPRSGGGAESVG